VIGPMQTGASPACCRKPHMGAQLGELHAYVAGLPYAPPCR